MSSNVIDNKIVEMQFENRQFEKNADQSIRTLDKLQDSLNFSGATKSLDQLSDASKKINFDSIADSVEAVKVKFSAWDTIAMNVISRITNKIVDMGEQFVKSVSGIQMINAGFDKYEQKVTAVQTIMSATANTWKENAEAIGFEGTQMEFVNEQLEKLNWFSDETSFSFTDMTSNIGKFTSSGVALDKAVTAMEGISVWAAKSGQNAQSASRAYYNLSQAISVGAVKLIDWKSIENANMATLEFKQTAIDTAVELKYLKKVGDGLYKTTKGNEVTVENFNEALKDGWFSSEVLMSTLEQYGKAATRLSQISEEYDVTATNFLYNMDKWLKGEKDIDSIARSMDMSVEDLLPLFEELNKEEYKLGLSAFKAAQEAKTFTEAIEATKDAVSTGWMKTFEIIFGNYEEAKVIWTEMANRLWDVFAAGGETRNEILSIWKAAGGQQALVDGFWDLWDAVSEFSDVIKEAFGEIFNTDVWYAAGKLDAFTTKFKNFVKTLHMSDETADKIKRTFKGLFALFDILKDSLKVITIPLKTVLGLFVDGANSVLGYSASLGDWIVSIRDALKEANTFEIVGTKIANGIIFIVKEVTKFCDMLYDTFKSEDSLIAKVLYSLSNTLIYFINLVADGFEELTGIDIKNFTDKITNVIKKFTDRLVEFAEAINFELIINKFKTFVSDLKVQIKSFKTIDTSAMKEFFNNLHASFKPLTFIFDVFDILSKKLIELVKKLSPVIGVAMDFLKKIFMEITEAFGALIYNADFNKFKEILKTGLLASIGLGIYNFIKNLKEGTEAFGGLKGTFESIVGILDGVKGCLKAWQQDIKSNILLKIAAAVAIISISLIALSGVDEDKLSNALSIITAEFIELIASMKLLSTINFAKITSAASVLIVLSVAILILSKACVDLSKINMDELTTGLMGLTAICFMVTKVAASLSKSSRKAIKGAGSLILFAIAIRLLVKPIKELGELDFNVLLKGLLGVLSLLEGISLFMKTNMKGSIKAGAMMILMAAAVIILEKAVEKFAKIDYGDLVKGLSSVALILYGMSHFMTSISGVKKMLSASVGMIAIATSMIIFAVALKKIGSLKIEEIGKGLLGVAGAMILFTGAMKLLPKDTLSKSIGMIAMATAITILAGSLEKFSKMSLTEIGKGLLMLGGALVIIVGTLNLLKGTVGAAASLLVLALALAILTPCLKALGNMPLENIGKAILVLAGAFAVIGIAAKLLKPLTPAILAFAASILLLGIGLTACGVGATLLAASILTLAGAGKITFDFIELALKTVISLIPEFVKSILNAVKVLFEYGGDILKSLGKFVVTAISVLLDTIDELMPRIVRFLTVTLVDLIEALFVTLKKLVPKFLDFIIFLLNQIAANIGPIVDAGVTILLGIFTKVIDRMPEITDTLVSLVITAISNIATAIDTHSGELADAFTSLFESGITALLTVFGFEHNEAKKMSSTAVDAIKSFIKGTISMSADLIEAYSMLFDDIWYEIKYEANIMYNFGKKIMNSLKKGVVEPISDVIEAYSMLFDDIWYEIKYEVDAMYKFGKNLMEGLLKGINEIKDKVTETITNLAKKIPSTFSHILQIQSPSKVFYGFGKYIDYGLLNGINDYSKDVYTTVDNLSDTTIDKVKTALDNLTSTVEDNDDLSPTITPVLDLSSFNSDLSYMKDILSKTTLKDVNITQRGFNRQLEVKNTTGNIVSVNNDILKAINDLKVETKALGDYIGNLELRLDSSVLVGGIASKMNKKLGQYMLYSERGN